MHVRITTYPKQTITFTSNRDVDVTIPIEIAASSSVTEMEFDIPDLTSITVVGELASVTGGE